MIAPTLIRGLIQGMAVGFAIAAPVGPIGLLCIRRCLVQGAAAGIASGAGAAVADAAYGLVSVLGLQGLTTVLVAHAAGLRVGGGVLLVVLGFLALRRSLTAAVKPLAAAMPAGDGRGLATVFGATLALTLTNPMTILSFAGIMAALADHGSPAAAFDSGLILVLGVFCGSMAWWLVLVGGVTMLRRALPAAALAGLEGFSGSALIAFGLYAVVRGLAPA